MMGVKESDIKEVIGRWVEHTLQMEVKDTRPLWQVFVV
jgi:hypothetical protein